MKIIHLNIFLDGDTPLIQHQESKEGINRLNSRGGSGRKVDLSNADDEPILETKSNLLYNELWLLIYYNSTFTS